MRVAAATAADGPLRVAGTESPTAHPIRVAVYYNLHRKCWSVQSRERDTYGRVLAHVGSLLLTDCQFVVRETGRQRVLREQRKNVHAFVVGTWDPTNYDDWTTPTRVTYNPYLYDSFVQADTLQSVSTADAVFFSPTKSIFASL